MKKKETPTKESDKYKSKEFIDSDDDSGSDDEKDDEKDDEEVSEASDLKSF